MRKVMRERWAAAVKKLRRAEDHPHFAVSTSTVKSTGESAWRFLWADDFRPRLARGALSANLVSALRHSRGELTQWGDPPGFSSLHPHLPSKERESLAPWRPARTDCSLQEWLTPHGIVSWGRGLWPNGVVCWRQPGLQRLGYYGSNHPLPKFLANWVMTRLQTREDGWLRRGLKLAFPRGRNQTLSVSGKAWHLTWGDRRQYTTKTAPNINPCFDANRHLHNLPDGELTSFGKRVFRNMNLQKPNFQKHFFSWNYGLQLLAFWKSNFSKYDEVLGSEYF
jgi:hypothetical protein